MSDQDNDDGAVQLDRRSTLSVLGAGAGAVIGIGALSGSAVAWDRFDVCFRGCSEAWMIVTESDIDLGGSNDPPAVAHVIVTTDSGLECRPVEFTAANATTVPGKFGESPVVKHTVGSGEKILGVLEYNYNPDPENTFADPVWCVKANENNCANTPNTPDLMSARCLEEDTEVCSENDYCSGTDDDPEDP